MCIIIITLLLTAIFLLYLHITRNFSYWKNRNVPYLKPIPLFGNVLKVCAVKISLGDFLYDVYKTTNFPFKGFFVFDQPFLLIRDPNVIKSILIKDFDCFNDRTIMENKRDDELGSNMLFLLKNPTWKIIRTKVTGVFSTGKLKNMYPLMVEAADDMISHLKHTTATSNSVESRELTMKFATDVISSCAFGIKAHCFQNENAEFRQVSRRIFDWNFYRKFQMTCYFYAPMLVKLFKMKFVETVAGEFMENAFAATTMEREISSAVRGDLIDVLIQIKKKNNENGYIFEEKELIAQAVQFFVAGFETTGSTISFTLYELALNTEVQDRLRKEINTFFQDHGSISHECIQGMKYLDMVISETLRRYPLLSFLDRRCTQRYVLPGSDVVIEKGLPVYISLLGLHNDPEYFPNPEKFDPERFTYENKSSRPSCVYMPFGEGPHNCIGARFGLLVSKVAVMHIVKNFIVTTNKDTPIPFVVNPTGFLISPINGLHLNFEAI